MPASCCATWRPSTSVTAVTATSAAAARATRMPMRWRNLTGAFTSLHPDHLCLARIGVGGQVGDRTRVGEHICDRGGGRVGLGRRDDAERDGGGQQGVESAAKHGNQMGNQNVTVVRTRNRPQ